MSLRPVPARWFELLTARDDLTLAVETLARTHSVELETHSEPTTRLTLPDLHSHLEEYNRLAQHYQAYWPSEDLRPSELPGAPQRTLEKGLATLEAWQHEADPLIHALEALHSERFDLGRLREMLAAMEASPLRLPLLAAAGPTVAARLFMLPPHTRVSELPPGIITLHAHSKQHEFLLTVGPPKEVDTLEQELTLLKGRRLPLPGWLEESPEASLAALERRLQGIDEEEATLRERIEALQTRFALHEALGDITRLEWFLTHVEALPVSENFAWVTGWTSDATGENLRAALEKSGVRALLRFPDPPRDQAPPMVLRNPWWAQPFELFARLLGTPDRNEVDPSRLLALMVPLLFGYMFGDIGQGALLLIAGLVLRNRYPALRLLVPAGIASILFGVLFGSLFSREDLVPALWLHPIDDPIVILLFPLLGGVAILLLGLLLNGVEAHWRGQGGQWWRQEAGMLLLYLGLIGLFADRRAGGAALLGLLWFVGGSLARQPGRRLATLGGDLGLLLESTMQLAVNTLSFARVGAFALAHTGLSTAVVALADSAPYMALGLLIMVIGNAVIILLEGLVVSIQITRLVLFEFFIRFLRGEGRSFRPLAAPPAAPTQHTEKKQRSKG